MSVTPNMGLTLPTVLVTPGPTWAYQDNNAFTMIDYHDHSTGKGVRITPSGLNINSDLTFQSNDAIQLRSTQFDNLSATLTTPDLACVYVKSGDLWYTNAGGTPVQLTVGPSIASSTIGVIARQFDNTQIIANTTILPGDTFSYLEVETNLGAFTITLPAANSVAAGRFYEIKDIDGVAGTNNITITAVGGDTIDTHAGSIVISVDNASQRLVTDGSSKWFLQNFIGSDEGVTDQHVVRYDGTTGKFVNETTNVAIDDADNMFGLARVTATEFQVGGTSEAYFINNPTGDKTIDIADFSSGIQRPIVVSAQPSNNGLMIVRGRVSAGGAALTGEGFTCSKTSTGHYAVSFDVVFLDTPAVVTVANDPGAIFTSTNTLSTSGFLAQTIDGSIAFNDANFSFIAIGQRGV